MFLHDTQELDNDLGRRANHDLALARALCIVDGVEAVVEHRCFDHLEGGRFSRRLIGLRYLQRRSPRLASDHLSERCHDIVQSAIVWEHPRDFPSASRVPYYRPVVRMARKGSKDQKHGARVSHIPKRIVWIMEVSKMREAVFLARSGIQRLSGTRVFADENPGGRCSAIVVIRT